MGSHFPPDKMLQQKAKKKFGKILLQKPLMERFEPVMLELKWVLEGRPNPGKHQKILPEYCYNILSLYERTILKPVAPFPQVFKTKDKQKAAACKTIEELKTVLMIDWTKFGSCIATGERAMMFFDKQAGEKLKQEGLLDLSEKEADEICKLMVGEKWIEYAEKKLQSQDPEKPIEEIIQKALSHLEETITKAVPVWHQKAKEWEPEAVTEFHQGIAKGSAGFLDKSGELVGQRKIKLKSTYEFLLICWPEIEEMLKAKPPKTRNHLWDWLKPFSYAQWIEIQDLEQLNRLCSAIKLKLKNPGAPRKTK